MSPASPAVGIVRHAIEGRVRLRISPSDPVTLGAVERRIREWPHARSVGSNPGTGSILVHHDGSLAELSSWLEGLLDLRSEDAVEPAAALRATADALTGVDRAVRHQTRGTFDLRTALFAGLVGVATVQALRGQLFGPAASIMGTALGVLSLSRRGVGLPPAGEERSAEPAREPDS